MKALLLSRLEQVSVALSEFAALPPRRQATIAGALSIALHFIVLLLAALFMGIERDLAEPLPKPGPREIVLELAPPPPPPVPKEEPRSFSLDEKREREFIDSAGLAKAEKAREEVPFESDKNMVAASEKAGKGAEPLPSIDGRTGLPFTNFKTQDVTLGAKPAPSAPAVPPSPPVTPVQPATPVIPPTATPAPATPVPQPTPPPPKATPPPLKKVETPSPDEIAIAEQKPATPPPAITRVIPATPVAELARLVTPAPRPAMPDQAGFQPQLEKTRIEGSISNRGKAAVDAVRTPLALYKKQISEAVGSRWYFYIRQNTDKITLGQASFSFFVDRRGKVQSVTVLSNTSNSSFAMLCERSIREAEIAPPPPEAVAVMKNGVLEVPFTFTFYDPH